ncbi:ClpXP protease specificity-enhancing factor [Caballeronia sordidicola]|jgi:stringent starvation protein B|uniref:ClpXP protease specificity-enhancing factor / Stringent starvation protein B n=1 Tax=Caballeronia sordidicola TaxID=196367 RepID=A0A226WMB3_CABSO|nr:ClpXP protease specificity-enhancing factor [Caballeronia sordidicola]OXC71960.1 ClpXP protease specificity-enhancing factor / Stringent starvation protein B [Caballeronia sordidicola]
MQEISTKPYLLRALYEWCTDNGFTPHIAVRVDNGTRVPRQFVRNDEIVLNISFEATSQLQMGNEWIEFSARFSGKSHKIEVQVTNVLAIYARENGQGMAFPVDPAAIGAAPDVSGEGSGPRSSELGPEESGAERIERRETMASARDTRDDDESPPDDDGSKSSGRGHLKVVK